MGQKVSVRRGCNENVPKSLTRKQNNDSLQRHLVREQQQDIHEVYEIVGIIGEGSISNIYKIVKKKKRRPSDNLRSIVRRRSSSLLCKSHKKRVERRSTISGQQYALKEIDTAFVKEGLVDELKNEIELLKDLDHPNIIKAYETYYYKRKLSMVLELCAGGDLYTRNPYTEINAANVAKQILSAVNYMHKRNVIHRDLKFENCMFESRDVSNWTVKIIDFGLARVYGHRKMTARVGTVYTMSPETLRSQYTSKADLWSVGVMVYMLLSGTKPFWGKTRNIVTKQILSANYNFDADVWKDRSREGKQFVSSLLELDQQKRLSAEQALRHPWFSSKANMSKRKPDPLAMRCAQARLVQYAESGEFRRVVMNVVAKKATTEDILELREIFNEYDSNHDGMISFKEWKRALARSNLSDEVVQSIFRKLDVNRNNILNYTEFVASILEIRERIDEAKLDEAFELLDTDNSGYIDAKDLRCILGKTGTNSYVKGLLDEADIDKDGRVSMAEFKAYMTKKNEENIESSIVA
jgi:serine/threonine protein kinase